MAEGGPQARRHASLLREAEHLLHRNRWVAVALLAAALIFSAAAVGYELLKRPADVHNPNATFVPQKPKAPPKEAKTVNWPMYGLNPARTRYLPAKGIKPPFRKLWRYKDKPLLEFPPIYVGGKLYFVNNNGFAYALDADTGKTLWERRIGELNASSPTYYRHRLYIVNLVPGHIVKLDAATGKTIWKKSLPSRAESSPVVVDRTVYFGCEDGGLYALNTISGSVRWATQLGGPVKAAPAYYGGRLYVGDYGGYMNAVDAKSGKLIWQSGSLGPGFGASGQFYSTPPSPSAASTPATTTAASTALTSATASSPGATRPAATPTRARPSPAPSTARRPSSSAPSTATSTRSTPRTVACAGAAPPAAR